MYENQNDTLKSINTTLWKKEISMLWREKLDDKNSSKYRQALLLGVYKRALQTNIQVWEMVIKLNNNNDPSTVTMAMATSNTIIMIKWFLGYIFNGKLIIYASS